MKTNVTPSSQLAHFVAELEFDHIPAPVMRRAEDLFLDWFGSALAGKVGRPVQAIEAIAREMGPMEGRSEVLISRRKTSPLFAAMVNGASSHFIEQDDVHNGSVFHPAAVIFPPALAVAQAIGASGKDFITASVVGYEVGIRVGEFLGRSHYKIFHTTGTAGTVAAAVTVGRLLKLNPEQMLNAIGSAGTQAAGLWEFLRDAADSKQLHTAHAAANGLASAYLALDGFTGARRILEGAQGMAAGMSTDADPAKLVDRLGTRWALPETSFKFHASCRHTHPAADALQQAMKQNGLRAGDVASVVTHVHQGAIDVLGPVTDPQTVHQSKFSMGTVLALIALRNSADLAGFDGALKDAAVANFRDRVTMELDEEVDTAYPQRWIGKVTVKTTDGRSVTGRVDEPKGDPGNTLSRDEIEFKAMRLGTYEGAATEAQVKALIQTVWGIRGQNVLGDILAKA
jgi:2-methylcitrate dehydratase PrpD